MSKNSELRDGVLGKKEIKESVILKFPKNRQLKFLAQILRKKATNMTSDKSKGSRNQLRKLNIWLAKQGLGMIVKRECCCGGS